jgi:SulP family sulfate permease
MPAAGIGGTATMQGGDADRAGKSASTGLTPAIIPALRGGYGATDLRADALAGLTVAIVALPLSMAIAIASGLPPERGLYTAIVGGFIISLLGGSRHQIGGPAGAFIVLVYAVVERHGYDGLVLATMLAGAMMAAAGLLRLGRFIRLIPPPVIVGFTAGIAAIILLSQLRELLGLDIANEPAAAWPKLVAIAAALPTLKPQAVLIAAACVAAILVQRRFRPAWPGFLIVVAAAGLYAALAQPDVATIGSRFGAPPSGLPAPRLPEIALERLAAVLPDAVAIALLGAIESLLSALVADEMARERHNSDAELLAQGAANVLAAVFGGFCVTGTIARTATNVKAGGRTPVSGMLHSAYLLAFVLIAGGLTSHVPLAALGAVLAVVAWNMADREHVATFLRQSRVAAIVVLTTFVLTVFANLLVGIAAGVALHAVASRAQRFRL